MIGNKRLLLVLLLGILGCATAAPESDDWVAKLSVPLPHVVDRSWPLPAPRAEQELANARGEVRKTEDSGAGVTGAMRYTVYFPSLGREVALKWKAAPPGDADGWNNAPRKELAAYELQKWFLGPETYVVPTSVVRCIPLEDYRRIDPDARPTLEGTRCVVGMLALWLENVEVPEQLFDEERFRHDPAYARHLADFNILAYLIDDRDTRPGNVLTSTDPSNRRVYSVDNGISFDPLLYNFFRNDWSEIRVPALPRDAIERLRAVDRKRARELAVVAELELDDDGMLRSAPPGPPLDPDRGARYRDGVLQLGLTRKEIDHVLDRVQSLLRQVAERRIPLF